MKKLTLSLLCLALSQVASFAGVDLGANTSHTPYDAYMSPVKQVLGGLSHEGTSLDRVNALMREGRDFRYSFTTPYVAATPAVTAQTRSGDCKAKALWLCSQMGDESVRFVVGKLHSNSNISHAWVLWQHEGRYWILDCTNTARIIPADSVSSNDYVMQYSWSKSGVYRHGGSETSIARVAGKRSHAPVADQGMKLASR
jgi:hypothetical protein